MTSFEQAVADLDYMVELLDAERDGVVAAKTHLDAIQEEINALYGPRLKAAKARLDLAKTQASELDAQIRTDALGDFRIDPTNKRPHPAIGIRVKVEVKMDQDAALAYALAKGRWIKLDLVPFKRDAKAALLMSEPDPELVAFAELTEIPTATIAKDLKPYLDADNES